MEAGTADKLPTAMAEQRMATGEDFGAQSGRALQQLGDSISSFGARVKANQKQLNGFDTEAKRIKLEGDIQNNNAVDARKLSGNGEGFLTTQRDSAIKQYDALITSTKDPDLKGELEVKKQAFIKDFSMQAFKQQYAQQDAHSSDVLDEDARQSGLKVQQSPASADQLIQQHRDLIEKSTLPPEEKIKRQAMDSANLAYTAQLSLAKNNPRAVIAGGSRAQAGMQFFMSKGWTKEQAAGIMGNLLHESGLNTSIVGDPSLPGGSVGIGQWNRERLKNLKNYAAAKGTQFTDYQTQLEFAQHELETSEAGAGAALKNAKTVDEATAAAIGFERPQGWTPDNPQGGHGWKSRRAYAEQVAGGGDGGVTDSSASRQYLTPQQSAQVEETAYNTVDQNLRDEQVAAKAQHNNDMNALLTNLQHGDSPQSTYAAAYSSGMLADHDDDAKAIAVMHAREKDGEDLRVGTTIMTGQGATYNQFDPDQKKGVNAWYNNAIKGGANPADVMAYSFERTGTIPTDAFSGIRSGVNSTDKGARLASLTTAANMMDTNPNTFAGQDGANDVEGQVARFKSRVNLGDSGEQAVATMMAQEQEDKANPVKKEQVDAFVRDTLTQQNVETTVKSMFNTWSSSASLPVEGGARSAINGIFSEMAKEGYRKFGSEADAITYAKQEFTKQFGVQRGVITRFSPDKANLPSGSKFPALKVEGDSTGYGWINKQAADLLNKQNPTLHVDADQIILLPIKSHGYDTQAAWSGHPDTVNRPAKDGRGEGTVFKSIPYRIMVQPKDVTQVAYPPINSVFYPDPESFVTSAVVEAGKPDANTQGAKATHLNPYPKPQYRTLEQVQAEASRRAQDINAAAKTKEEAYLQNFANLPEDDPLVVEANKRARAGDDEPRIQQLLSARRKARKQ